MPSLRKLSSKPLFATFGAEAEKIWNGFDQARKAGVIRDEETVTSLFLLNIHTAHPTEVEIFQFNKQEEKLNGADWEWWLTDGRKWLGFLVQAKKLNPLTHRYNSITHKVGEEKRPQIELILQQAKYKGIDALYFFYNFSAFGSQRFQWNCKCVDLAVEQLGCTVAHATLVEAVIRQGGGGRCLVCCSALAASDDSLPSRAYGVIRNLPGAEGGPAPRSNPPEYVQRLVNTPLANERA